MSARSQLECVCVVLQHMIPQLVECLNKHLEFWLPQFVLAGNDCSLIPLTCSLLKSLSKCVCSSSDPVAVKGEDVGTQIEGQEPQVELELVCNCGCRLRLSCTLTFCAHCTSSMSSVQHYLKRRRPDAMLFYLLAFDHEYDRSPSRV